MISSITPFELNDQTCLVETQLFFLIYFEDFEFVHVAAAKLDSKYSDFVF